MLPESWPRLIDNQTQPLWRNKQNSRLEPPSRDLSNIAKGESSTSNLQYEALPPLITQEEIGPEFHKMAQANQKNAESWIILCTLIILFSMIIESLFLFYKTKRKLLKRSSNLLFGICIIFALNSPKKAHAHIVINYLKKSPTKKDLRELALDVNNRTSIELSSKIISINTFKNR